MSLTSSPQQDIQALVRRRNLTVIPKDQQKILDKEGSWAVEANQRQGQPQVPSHVLETITEAFLLRKKHMSKPANGNELPKTVQLNGEGEKDGITGKRETVKTKDVPKTIQCSSNVDRDVESLEDQANKERQDADDDQQSDDQSSTSSRGHTPLTWSPSPSRSARERPPTTPSQSQAVQETPVPNPRPELFNALPQSQTHHPTVGRVEEDEEEDEMDMQLPQAYERPDARINIESTRLQATSTPAIDKTSQAVETETPPCAQPNQNVVPDTVDAKRVSVAVQPRGEQRRRHIFKPIEFGGNTPTKPVNASTSFTRLPNTSRRAEVESSISTLSSSLIPATCTSASTQISTAAAAAAPPLPSSLPLRNPNDHEPRTLTSSKTYTSTGSQTHFINQVISPAAPLNPYALFISTYPSYPSQNGTLKNFIKACLCLEYLETWRALHEFLYDDFIRAFSAAYLKYVAGARAGQEPLPAIEWFNMLQGKPQYSKMVITRQNLHSVLDMFPGEVARARRQICQVATESEREQVVERRERRPGGDDVVHEDVQTPDISPPRAAKRPRPTPSSPELGSDVPDPPEAASSSAVRSKAPRTSQYFETLELASKNDRQKQSSAGERLALLREHFRKKRASSARSPQSRHGSR